MRFSRSSLVSSNRKITTYPYSFGNVFVLLRRIYHTSAEFSVHNNGDSRFSVNNVFYHLFTFISFVKQYTNPL